MRIPRTVVPEDCPAPTAAPTRPPRRLKTWLDERKLVPQDMPVIPFQGESTIPSHVPLDVLNNRVLIARDMPVVPFPPELAGGSEPTVTELDDRVVVPHNAHIEPTLEAEPFSEAVLRDLVEIDVLVSGEARLLPEKRRRFNWDFLAPAFSVVFHLMLIILFLSLPRVLAPYEVTPTQEAMNQQNLGYVYLPKNLKQIPKPKPVPEKRSDKMRIETGKRNQLLAPPKPEASQQRGPEPKPAPKVQSPKPAPPVESAENRPQPRPEPPKPKPQPRLEPVTPDTKHPMIAPPDLSPGRALKQTLRDLAKQADKSGVIYGQRIPLPRHGPGGPGQQAGPGQGYLENGVQILTPTEGVDFSSYIARLLAMVKRNWYAVMPESAMLGDKGRVMLRFRILRDGDVPNGNPILELSSGKRPLDRAAVAAITASNPFDPLPSAYTRPYIELRIIFLYNLPLPGH